MRNSYIEDFTTEELEILIDKYFDCELSEHEELLLHNIIALTKLDSTKIREFKAVTGFLSKARKTQTSAKTSSFRRWMHVGIAACVATLLGVGAFHFHGHQSPALNRCVAYVGHDVIEDETTVLLLIKKDIDALKEASSLINESMEDDLQSLNDALSDLSTTDDQPL